MTQIAKINTSKNLIKEYTGQTKANSRHRLETIDGLRALAALGVLWIHSWTIHGNPRFRVYGIDVSSLLAIGGNGVDLFFVISGFCMYYFYVKKENFTYANFATYLKQRWWRLSPAFYIATIAYIFFRWEQIQIDKIYLNVLTSIFYLNSFSQFNVEGLFWSLSTEWQFYMLIPFILIYQKKIGFKATFIVISAILLLTAITSVLLFKKKSDILTDQILFRYFEFACGILTAKFFVLSSKSLPKRQLFFFIFLFLIYFGRYLISAPILALSSSYYNIFKLLGFTIMCAGFAGFIHLSITSSKYLKTLLGNRFLSYLGRISYSFYLWHGIIHVSISKFVLHHFELDGISAPLITFIISTLILIPVAHISFILLEEPFLRLKHNANR